MRINGMRIVYYHVKPRKRIKVLLLYEHGRVISVLCSGYRHLRPHVHLLSLDQGRQDGLRLLGLSNGHLLLLHGTLRIIIQFIRQKLRL